MKIAAKIWLVSLAGVVVTTVILRIGMKPPMSNATLLYLDVYLLTLFSVTLPASSLICAFIWLKRFFA